MLTSGRRFCRDDLRTVHEDVGDAVMTGGWWCCHDDLRTVVLP